MVLKWKREGEQKKDNGRQRRRNPLAQEKNLFTSGNEKPCHQPFDHKKVSLRNARGLLVPCQRRKQNNKSFSSYAFFLWFYWEIEGDERMWINLKYILQSSTCIHYWLFAFSFSSSHSGLCKFLFFFLPLFSVLSFLVSIFLSFSFIHILLSLPPLSAAFFCREQFISLVRLWTLKTHKMFISHHLLYSLLMCAWAEAWQTCDTQYMWLTLSLKQEQWLHYI